MSVSGSWERGQWVTVELSTGVRVVGTISGFPSKKVEYATRPVIVKLAPAEYLTTDLSNLRPR